MGGGAFPARMESMSAPRSDPLPYRLPLPSEATRDLPSTTSEALAELPESDVTAVLQAIALEARALTNAESVALGIGGDPDKVFEPWVFVGIPREGLEHIGRHPRAVGLLGAVARAGEVIRCKDLRDDHR
ncbi:MAG: Sensory box histidine kinase, partial [Labilithrix sp.]|nr:Sensory box histidine kinase [Labilithrix sp.]